MKLLYHGPADAGETSLQRLEAFERIDGIEVVRSPVRWPPAGRLRRLMRSVAWRLRLPFDSPGENRQLLRLAREHRPDVVFVCNSRMLRASTMAAIRRETGAMLVYFSPDDALAPHNQTKWLKATLPLWDLFFTTKTFNVDELHAAGVRRAILTENTFDPRVHRPMTPEEVGDEYEAYDLVFVGAFEEERAQSLKMLAEAGFRVLVCGHAAGLLSGSWQSLLDAGVTVRPPAMHLDYSRAVHRAKVPLGFLRKINRDQITTRSVELPAMRRAMLAEKTDEHDTHFIDGAEYVGFSSDAEMIAKARMLVEDADARQRIADAGYARCFASQYDVDSDMRRMLAEIEAHRARA